LSHVLPGGQTECHCNTLQHTATHCNTLPRHPTCLVLCKRPMRGTNGWAKVVPQQALPFRFVYIYTHKVDIYTYANMHIYKYVYLKLQRPHYVVCPDSLLTELQKGKRQNRVMVNEKLQGTLWNLRMCSYHNKNTPPHTRTCIYSCTYIYVFIYA